MLALFVRGPAIVVLAAIALGMAAANPAWALGDPDAASASDSAKEDHPMSLVPKARTNRFAAVSDSSKRRRAEQENADADWPTDDFGRPLRNCDVPWDYVPRSRK